MVGQLLLCVHDVASLQSGAAFSATIDKIMVEASRVLGLHKSVDCGLW